MPTFKSELVYLEDHNIALDHVKIIKILNAFLRSINSPFQLIPGQCNGFSAWFSRYAVHGKSLEWLNKIMAIQQINPSNFSEYKTQLILMETIISISQFQKNDSVLGNNEHGQLHMEKINMIEEIDFVELTSESLHSYISDKKNKEGSLNKMLHIRFIDNLSPSMKEGIYISLDDLVNAKYKAISMSKSSETTITGNSLLELCAWIQHKAPSTFSYENNTILIISLIDNNKLDIVLKDSAYVLLGHEAFHPTEILKNIEPGSVALLGIENHTMSIYKCHDNNYVFYNTWDDLPEIHSEDTLADHLEQLKGHASIYLFERADCTSNTTSLFSKIMFEKLKKISVNTLYVKTAQDSSRESAYESQSDSYENGSEDSMIEEPIYDTSSLEALCLFCIRSNHEDVLLFHLKQIDPLFLQELPDLLPDFVISGYYDLVKLYIEKEIQLNSVDEDGMTLLHLACLYQHPDIVKCLLEKGAVIEIPNHANNTVFETALVIKNKEILFFLLDHTLKSKLMDLLPPDFVNAVYQFAAINKHSNLQGLCKTLERSLMDNKQLIYHNNYENSSCFFVDKKRRHHNITDKEPLCKKQRILESDISENEEEFAAKILMSLKSASELN